MRITGGIARGRKLLPPKSNQIRPTCDRVREALFNILGPRPLGALVLDCFAGTGAIGIEALSRGPISPVHRSEPGSRALIEANLRAAISPPQGRLWPTRSGGRPSWDLCLHPAARHPALI